MAGNESGGRREHETCNIVRDHFRRFEGDVLIEEQSSASPAIDKLLRNASKKGCGKGNLAISLQLSANSSRV